jgi:hypothetical protein
MSNQRQDLRREYGNTLPKMHFVLAPFTFSFDDLKMAKSPDASRFLIMIVHSGALTVADQVIRLAQY